MKSKQIRVLKTLRGAVVALAASVAIWWNHAGAAVYLIDRAPPTLVSAFSHPAGYLNSPGVFLQGDADRPTILGQFTIHPQGGTSTPGELPGEELLDLFGHVTLDLWGTGSLADYRRTLQMAIETLEIAHEGLAMPGAAAAEAKITKADAQRFIGWLPPGDPDFDLLRITAGTDLGLPSPGQTTLTQLPGGQWQVDSFFDITYRIEFEGTPTGVLGGSSGEVIREPEVFRPGAEIPAGDMHWESTFGESWITPPIPADFFGPGSDPFTGTIELKGVPLPGLGNTDTIVRRLGDTHGLRFPEPGADTIPIEIVQLDLVSIEPIRVTFDDGSEERWDVRVELSPEPEPPSLGEMTITQTDHQGGTFDSFFDVFVDLIFTNVDDPTRVKQFQWTQLDGPLKFSLSDPAPFSHLALSEMIDELLPAGNFLAGVAKPVVDVGKKHTFIFTDGAGNQFAWRLAVPEPGALTLLLGAALPLLGRRRKRRSKPEDPQRGRL